MQTAVSNEHGRITGNVVPQTMRAAVYVGEQTIDVRTIDTPHVGPGEILIRVEACGICHTDLKKIEYGLLPAPRIFGHETAGVVAAIGPGVRSCAIGDRVLAFHHIPCKNCFYCYRKLYAQCPTYKKVGITAGYEPAGGGFSQYVRVMDWVVRDGVEKIPAAVPFDRACLVEPLNTCLKAVVQLEPNPGDVCLILGQGPIGMMFTMLMRRSGALVAVTDTMQSRLQMAREFGAVEAWNARDTDTVLSGIKRMTDGRGADIILLATSAPGLIEQAVRCSRPGANILLFAQTSDQERIEVSGADICVGERRITGSYSASVDLQRQSAELVFGGELPLSRLITHRFPLENIATGIDLALHPDEKSLKIIVEPQRWS